jgi:hypothetical protein
VARHAEPLLKPRINESVINFFLQIYTRKDNVARKLWSTNFNSGYWILFWGEMPPSGAKGYDI